MKRTVFCILALCLFVPSLSAAPLTWTLDATTTNAESISGTFDYDADLSTFSNININGALAFFDDLNAYNPGSAQLIFTNSDNDNLEIFVNQNFPLTPLGGTFSITSGTEFRNAPFTSRTISGGTLEAPVPVPAPEPSTLLLLGSGLLGLVALKRRRA